MPGSWCGEQCGCLLGQAEATLATRGRNILLPLADSRGIRRHSDTCISERPGGSCDFDWQHRLLAGAVQHNGERCRAAVQQQPGKAAGRDEPGPCKLGRGWYTDERLYARARQRTHTSDVRLPRNLRRMGLPQCLTVWGWGRGKLGAAAVRLKRPEIVHRKAQ